ncbi:hypothetical protein PIB30_014868 [Stylosanthes scabra]|uniref:RNase H type-1 domain-containing protein n=1 Tax=Stylosanthes scabra TaxID=79078 RepID=A0ABU6S6R3_9FABA|nr:hypothetical protein [Stylosanthes scabra]
MTSRCGIGEFRLIQRSANGVADAMAKEAAKEHMNHPSLEQSCTDGTVACAAAYVYYDIRKKCEGSLCYDFSNNGEIPKPAICSGVTWGWKNPFCFLYHMAFLMDWMRNLEVGIPAVKPRPFATLFLNDGFVRNEYNETRTTQEYLECSSSNSKNIITPSPNHHHFRHSHLHLKPLINIFSSSSSSSSSYLKVIPHHLGRTTSLVVLKISSFLSKLLDVQVYGWSKLEKTLEKVCESWSLDKCLGDLEASFTLR